MTKFCRWLIVLSLFIFIFGCFLPFTYGQGVSDKTRAPQLQKTKSDKPPFKDPLPWRAGLEVVADMNVNPPEYVGVCPTVFTFKGQISSNKAMSAHYRILRSDNVRTEPVPVSLKKNVNKEITYTWQLGAAGESVEINAWVILQVIYPTNMKAVSNVVQIKGKCTNYNTEKQSEAVQQENKPSQALPGDLLIPRPGSRGPGQVAIPKIGSGQKIPYAGDGSVESERPLPPGFLTPSEDDSDPEPQNQPAP